MAIPEEKEREREEKIYSLLRQQEERRAQMLAQKYGLPYINLIATPIQMDALMKVPEETARKGNFAVFSILEKRIGIATTDPENEILKAIIEEFKREGFEIKLFICSKSSLERAWKEYVHIPPPQKELIGKIEISSENIQRIKEEVKNLEDLTQRLNQSLGETGLFFETILGSAFKFNASDIHIIPEEKKAKLRYRIDGIMYTVYQFDLKHYFPLVTRIKILANLKINVRNVAQDGRFTIDLPKKQIEVRVSVAPGEYGEDVVMRILDPKMLLSIEQLGLHPWLEKLLLRHIHRPTGMILACGPTGSGKTTTIYACLMKIAKPEVKVITIEQPIEYHLKNVDQIQVDPEHGYTFEVALQAALRQDPDVILIGEIRERETANTALQAALTGHLVFTTLHTNDAAGVVPRLIEMGATPNVIAPALNLAIAQRLVRRVCKNCAEKIEVKGELKEKIQKNLENLPENIKPNLEKIEIYKAKGCEKCYFTGYKGRIGIFEMFEVTPKIEEAILSYPSISKMRKVAIEEGMITMKQDCLLRVIEGVTTLEELERVTGRLE